MKKTIDLKGLHCKSCVRLIEDEISQMEGVKGIEVSLEKSNATINFDANKASLDDIKSKIADLGYSADRQKDRTLAQGIAYGLLPHIGCIAFIVGSVLGVTVLTQFFRPLLMNPYFFHILIIISIGFATLSSAIYLRNNGMLSRAGAARKWKYLTTMYGSTIGINLVLFMLIFPLLANVSLASTPEGVLAASSSGGSSILLQVDIPCPGHAPLISGELKTIEGVESIEFSFPNLFDVAYDSSRTTKQQILSLEVFDTYKATVMSENAVQTESQTNSAPAYSVGCGCGGYTCGGAGSCCGA